MNEVCCIKANYSAETDNSIHRGQFIDESQEKDRHKNISNFENNIFYNSKIKINPLPLNKIKYTNQENGNSNELNSLTKLPISNRNVIRKKTGNPLNYYKIIKRLGRGTFGIVYKVKQKSTGIIRAMKVIPKNNLKCGFTEEDIIQEINILKKLEHPHIIKLFEFYTYKNNYYLINEFCTEGDLSEKLSELRTFPEFIVKILMIQIFNAVMYLNQNCVIHGDLKLENIMIDSFLNKDEIKTDRGNSNFIQSLLEDEKEINEYIKQKELKRSNSLRNLNIKNLNFNNEANNNINNIKDNYNTQKEVLDEDIKFRKRNSTKIKPSLFQNKLYKNKKNLENRKEGISSVNTINNTIGINSKNNKQSEFIVLNGEDEEEENENNNNNDSKNSDHKNGKIEQRSDEEIENRKERIHNIKVYNENYIENQLLEKETEIENDENNKKFQSGELINLKKTLTLNSMKMKNFELKLIDFGCAKIFSKYKKNFKDTIGTLLYCSPEVLKNNYNKECDIWSCGVIMYVLLSGHFPFFGKTEEEIEKKILSGKFIFNNKYFSKVSDKAKDLINKCLIYDKDKRIKAEEVIKHEFFVDDINPNNMFEDEIDSKNVLNSLKNYAQQSKIYQTVLAYLSHNFADKVELNKLKKIFYKIDLNLDGKLSKDELEIAYKEAGMEMKDEQLNKVIGSVDFGGNGFIEYEEFIRVTLPKEQLFTEKNLKYAFDMFDLNKSGTISLNEFKEILGINKIKDKNVNKELLKEIPIHGKEEMTFEQFKNILIG